MLMPIIPSTRRWTRSPLRVPPQSFTPGRYKGVIVMDRPGKPAATIHKELPLLVCLFKSKKGRDAS